MPNLSSTLDPELFQSVLPMHNNQGPSSIRASLDGNLRNLNARGNIPPSNNNNNNFNKGKQPPGGINFKGRLPNKKMNHNNNSNIGKVRT